MSFGAKGTAQSMLTVLCQRREPILMSVKYKFRHLVAKRLRIFVLQLYVCIVATELDCLLYFNVCIVAAERANIRESILLRNMYIPRAIGSCRTPLKRLVQFAWVTLREQPCFV